MHNPPNDPTRRQFCTRSAALSAAAALSATLPSSQSHAESKPAPFKLNYILASCMYGEMKLTTILPEVKKTGATHLDIWPRVHGNQREQVDELGVEKTKQLLEKHDVKMGMITQYKLGPLRLNQEMKLMNQLGASVIISGSKGPRNVTGGKAKAGVKEFLEKMKPQIAAAEEHDVIIGIENHANALIHTPDSIRYFVDLNKSKHIGIALAPYHLPQDPGLIAELIKHCGEQLVHFYAWEHGDGCHKKIPKVLEMKQMPGRGPLDFKPIVQALKTIHYQNWTSIFMHPVPRGIPILPEASQVTHEINLSREYLESLI